MLLLKVYHPQMSRRPASADRLDSAAAAVAIPGPSALPPDADATPPPATPFYFVTLEPVCMCQGFHTHRMAIHLGWAATYDMHSLRCRWAQTAATVKQAQPLSAPPRKARGAVHRLSAASCLQIPSAESPHSASPAASPRRSPRRSTGLVPEPAARGPPWGDQITLGPLLGRGAASKVFRGLRDGKPVALKVDALSSAANVIRCGW